MKITKEEVAYVAHLARLEFSEEETDTFTSQLNSILFSMEKLNEVDTGDVMPMSHAISIVNAFRDDGARESLGHDLTLSNAPEAKGGCFLVPKVVE